MYKQHWTLLALACGITLSNAQQYGSSSSYGSPSSSSSSYGSSSYGSTGTGTGTGSSSSSSVSYPSINLPLLSIPVTVGNASYSTGSTSTSTGTTNTSAVNFLATLGSAVSNLAAPAYANGVYPQDYDASRDYYYNHTLENEIYPLNIYTNPVNGVGGALNLSNAVAVSVAQWWAPYPYRLAQWNDGYTTTAASTSATSATVTSATGTATVASGSVVNASLYYAAYGGNIQNLGQPGLGIQVPGPAPTNILTPSINYAYNVGSSSATSAPSSSMMSSYGSSPSSYGSSSSSYGSSPSSYGSSSPMTSSYGGSSSGYGRRR